MTEVTTIGEVPWTRDDLRESLDDFETLYERRPIRDNSGGMKAPHMFAVWFMTRALAPRTIVESGIWKGQSTWLLENSCPGASIISIDLNLSAREYVSRRVTYSDRDFSEHNWSGITPDDALVFFDDHQNAYTRLQQCWWFGFRHVIFEDNYPPSQGDCYSLKKAFSGAGFQPELGDRTQVGVRPSQRLRTKIAALCGLTRTPRTPQDSRLRVPPNHHDAHFLRERLQTYYEFPPVFQMDKTRWGDRWDQERYPTPAPLLQLSETDAHRAFREEAVFYTWICYARLKNSANALGEID